MAKKKKTGKKLPPWLKDKGGKKEGEDEHDKNSASEGPHGEGLGSGKKSNGGGGGALAMAKAGKLYPVLDSVQSEDHTGHGHDCEKVHPGKSHKAWEILNRTDTGPGARPDEGRKKNYESIDVKRFISEISKKNYADANKYLQAALEDKMKSRIADTQHKLGF